MPRTADVRWPLDTMPAAVRALIAGGNAVIFDDVLHDSQMFESRRNAFADLDVFAIGVVCDLDILEARERSRGDRVLGRARGLVGPRSACIPRRRCASEPSWSGPGMGSCWGLRSAG
jgi:chloramphenicol 3-O-phosphotransferase